MRAVVIFVALAGLLSPLGAAPVPDATPDEVCEWWEINCRVRLLSRIEGLPAEASRTGVVITIDTHNNVISLFRDGELLEKAPVATGMDRALTAGGRTFFFHTPKGRHTVVRKVTDPVWTKPDWAFLEEGKKVPPPDAPERRVRGFLGKYALDLGDGIMIHGTPDKKSLGNKASHGCIRVGDAMLAKLYRLAKVGTEVYIF